MTTPSSCGQRTGTTGSVWRRSRGTSPPSGPSTLTRRATASVPLTLLAQSLTHSLTRFGPVSVGDDKSLRIWRKFLPGNPENVPLNGERFKWVCTSVLNNHHTRTIYSVSWSANNVIATGAGDDSIRIFAQQQGDDFAQQIVVPKGNQPSTPCLFYYVFILAPFFAQHTTSTSTASCGRPPTRPSSPRPATTRRSSCGAFKLDHTQ